MATAAHNLEIYLKTTAGAGGSLIAGMNTVSFSLNGEVLDTTAFDGGAFRTKIHGLRDFSVSVSGDWDASDAAYTLIKANFLDSSTALLHVRVLFDPSAAGLSQGYECQVLCESLEINGSVDGKVEVSFSLTSISALVIV
jgi:predicted secreted protein